jgi:hypothetical protein
LEPARAALALIAAGFGLSGSPQLANINATASNHAENQNSFILLIGCSITLLDKPFAVPGEAASNEEWSLHLEYERANGWRGAWPKRFSD